MRIPKAIQNLVESFERLPGIGTKSAQRLTFYLLRVPQRQLEDFALAVQNLKKNTVLCGICFTIDDTDPCSVCSDTRRDFGTICVVEEPLDVIALEKSGKYKGIYHVLHGRIDPLNNIGPDELYIKQLIERIKNSVRLVSGAHPGSRDEATKDLPAGRDSGQAGMTITEVILATNPTMEGEATAMYLAKKLKIQAEHLKITRIGRGLPIGADIEYADDLTLQRAMEGRQEFYYEI